MDEEAVKVALSDWLKNDFEIFWERTNTHGYGTFSVSGSRRKPDMYLRARGNPFWYNVVIEVKKGTDGHGIRSGSKIIDYMEDFTKGIVEYRIDSQLVIPKYFLVATEYSIDAHLFKDEPVKEPEQGSSREKLIAGGSDIVPAVEYRDSFQFIRQMWEEWKRRGKDTRTSLGMLTSKDGRPAIFCEVYNYGRWKQKVIR